MPRFRSVMFSAYVECTLYQICRTCVHGGRIDKNIAFRSLVVCRLTLFNGRRGEEPARMLLKEWLDAKNGKWLRRHEVSKISAINNTS